MPRDPVAYLLLAMDVLLAACLLTAPVFVVEWLAGRLRSRRRSAATSTTAADASPTDSRALRRCDGCGLLWKGRAAHNIGRTSLRVRRWFRRRRRAQKRPVPAWAQKQGWSRCPRCLSGQVRVSRAEATRR